MKILNVEPFEFEGEKYEIRVMQEADKYIVRVYLNEIPADPYEYTADRDKVSFLKIKFGKDKDEDILIHLVESAKEGIKIWKKKYLD